ncbi:MAG: hypothetical protein IPJ15_06605 [Actinomycetales bacterium]|nr:hypothetical protein [Candidatus Phosphoribacter baldrii]
MGQAHIEGSWPAARSATACRSRPSRSALHCGDLHQEGHRQGRHVKQSGGHGQYAVCDLEIEPLPRGGGFEFVDKVVGGAVPRNFIPSVEKGARGQARQGRPGWLPVGRHPGHPVRRQGPLGRLVRHGLPDGGGDRPQGGRQRVHGGVAEPIDAVDITVSDDYVGAVMPDLRGRRGQVLGTEPARESGWTIVHAEVPQTELSRYPIDLRSVSHGTGSFTRRQLRYDHARRQGQEYAKTGEVGVTSEAGGAAYRSGMPRPSPPTHPPQGRGYGQADGWRIPAMAPTCRGQPWCREQAVCQPGRDRVAPCTLRDLGLSMGWPAISGPPRDVR